MSDDTRTPRDEAYQGRALVAAFTDRERAHQAARRLHDEGFGRTWIGLTHPAATAAAAGDLAGGGTTHVSSDVADDSLGDKLGRFFSGDRTLYDELVRHGVAASEARRIEGSLAPSSTILTVDGHNHPELAAQIIERSGGQVLAGESFPGAAVRGYGDASRYARGETIDDQRRIALREERLSVDKQRVFAGEARLTKEVVAHQHEIDVPVLREELFIERRPVAETRADAGAIGEIGLGETIRVPLMREEIAVGKRAVVTSEIVVGKRQVSTTERVSGTVREERLHVDGPSGSIAAAGYDGDPSSATQVTDRTTGL